MSYMIQLNESNASRRVVYLWCVGSNGTTPASAEQDGQPTFSIGGRPAISTTSTLRAWNSGAGEYYLVLTQSEVSAVGPAIIRYNSGSAMETSTPFQVVAYDSADSQRLGLFALPNAAAEAAGGLITRGTGTGQLHVSSGSVGLIAQTHSGATLGGLTSGVTLFADTHSGATIQGVTRVNSSVTIANAVYSQVSVRVDAVAYSGVTLGVNNIAAGAYSGVTVETNNIAQSVRSQIADDVLRRDINAGSAGGRSVTDALRPLRNRVEMGTSTGTVYTEDDATSAWTFSISTTADTSHIAGINPAGGSA
jgi:hypothetical protein